MNRRFKFPLLMAWRETRAATGKFVFVVLSVALGAAALTAVTGFNESVRYTLLREARSLMAGDISLRMPIEPSAKELDFLDRLKSQGIVSTRVTEGFPDSFQKKAGTNDAGIRIRASYSGFPAGATIWLPTENTGSRVAPAFIRASAQSPSSAIRKEARTASAFAITESESTPATRPRFSTSA